MSSQILTPIISEFITNLGSASEPHHFGVLFVIGVSAFAGLLGSWFFQKIKVPQVVGYIVVGLIFGQLGLGLIDHESFISLQSFTFFALGFIGFLVGGELRIAEFKKYGKQFMSIVVGEGMGAFLLVGVLTWFLFYFLSGNVVVSFAGSIVLGAVASATDPASTISVLWEYRSKGVVTTAIIAIVALDDALAMMLYSVGKSVANLLVGEGLSIGHEILVVFLELSGALAIGGIIALILRFIIHRIHNKEKSLAISMSALLLVIGLSMALKLDVILASMLFGFGIANLLPKRSEYLFKTMRNMSTPIYVIFFVFVGARFKIVGIPPLIWVIAAVYIVGRSLGKFYGARAAAKLSSADKNVVKYAGYGLLAQGGVAIGLAIVAGQSLNGIKVTGTINLGDCIIAVITVTTIVVQLLGPAMTKLAIKSSEEMGKNITEEDVMQSMKLRDIISFETDPFSETDNIGDVVEKFSEDESSIKTVLNSNGDLVGVISFFALRDALPNRKLWKWVLVSDIMTTEYQVVSSNISVIDVIHLMQDTNQQALLVIDESSGKKEVQGIIEIDKAKKIINQELIKKIA